MTKCLRCQVDVYQQHTNCPLCGTPLLTDKVPQETNTSYPAYESLIEPKDFHIKMWLYITLIIAVFSLALNAVTWHRWPIKWSPTVAVVALYVWYIGKDLYLKFTINQIAKTLWKNYFFLTLVLLILDYSTGFNRWSLNYAIPILGIFTAVTMTTWSLKNKSMWRDDIGYILLTLSINLVPLILFFTKTITVLWPSVFSLLYGVLTIVGLFIFSGKRLLYELQKRFHY